MERYTLLSVDSCATGKSHASHSQMMKGQATRWETARERWALLGGRLLLKVVERVNDGPFGK